MGRCKSLDSLKSFFWYALQVSWAVSWVFISWVSWGLIIGSDCSLMFARWQVFIPSWVPSGLTSSLMMTKISFVYWYGRKHSTSQIYVECFKYLYWQWGLRMLGFLSQPINCLGWVVGNNWTALRHWAWGTIHSFLFLFLFFLFAFSLIEKGTRASLLSVWHNSIYLVTKWAFDIRNTFYHEIFETHWKNRKHMLPFSKSSINKAKRNTRFKSCPLSI